MQRKQEDAWRDFEYNKPVELLHRLVSAFLTLNNLISMLYCAKTCIDFSAL